MSHQLFADGAINSYLNAVCSPAFTQHWEQNDRAEPTHRAGRGFLTVVLVKCHVMHNTAWLTGCRGPQPSSLGTPYRSYRWSFHRPPADAGGTFSQGWSPTNWTRRGRIFATFRFYFRQYL